MESLCKFTDRVGDAALLGDQPAAARFATPLPFSTSIKVLPIRAGDGETQMPADSIAAILDSASPFPPEMIAPAWPMRRPGGAVRPAIKPTIRFLPPPFASSFVH